MRHETYFIRILEYIPNYFFGALYAYYFPQFNIKNRKIAGLLGVLFFMLLLVRIAFERSDSDVTKFILDRILPILMLFGVPYQMNLFSRECPDVFKAGFLIYAGQEVIITSIHYVVIEKLDAWICGYSLLLLRCVTVIVVVITCYVAWKILNKYFPKGLKLLTGGR